MTTHHHILKVLVATIILQAPALRAGQSLESLRTDAQLPPLQAFSVTGKAASTDMIPGKAVGAAEATNEGSLESIYEKLYAEGRAPLPAEVQGNWRGSALVFARQKPLPSLPLLNLIIEAVSLKFWDGKTFAGTEGANRLLGGRLKMFRFTTELRPSRTGSGQALALDYGRNPYPVSAIRDEVRLIADGRLLGRAYMHAPDGKDHFLFYFMLAKTEAR